MKQLTELAAVSVRFTILILIVMLLGYLGVINLSLLAALLFVGHSIYRIKKRDELGIQMWPEIHFLLLAGVIMIALIWRIIAS